MITISQALDIAVRAHEGQLDLDGLPVIWHPINVALNCNGTSATITGLLHDAVEDSSLTFDDLRKEGVDEEIITALQLLTHDKEKMSYEDYVKNIAESGNQLAIHVKLHDLEHNLARGRAGNHLRLVAKHEKAYEIIRKAVR